MQWGRVQCIEIVRLEAFQLWGYSGKNYGNFKKTMETSVANLQIPAVHLNQSSFLLHSDLYIH